jgi:23S rRNA (cytidine1920-2'-O)/16S rRNA (cytidine1409-2'-O)-methyltransferase
VYAVDVDVKQLDWRLTQDPRVVTVERNARFLDPAELAEAADLVTIDASFISLTLLLPRVPPLLKPNGLCLALVKPQFEVGRERVGKGGIVTDPADQQAAIDKIIQAGQEVGFAFKGQMESPIKGREGNREFFVLFEL